MLIQADLPGYRIDEVLGEVFGLTVRSRNVGSQIGASVKSLVGRELKGMTNGAGDARVTLPGLPSGCVPRRNCALDGACDLDA